MQIRNDFNSYSGTEYRQSHPHHMTKCLHEEGTKKPEAQSQGAGGKPDTFNPNNREEKGRQISPDPYREEAAVRKTGMKKGLKFVKDMWDAMGDDKGADGNETVVSEEGEPSDGVAAASSAVKQGFPHYIVNKWEQVREKVKTALSSALKRFGKGSGAFGALADPGNGKEGSREALTEKEKKGTRRSSRVTVTAAYEDSHLMDSYSKNGKYCRLGENLTYQKNTPEKKLENGAD